MKIICLEEEPDGDAEIQAKLSSEQPPREAWGLAFGHPPGGEGPRGLCHSPEAQPCSFPLDPLSTGEHTESGE